MSQKTYETWFSRPCVSTGVCFVAEKRLRHSCLSAAACFILGGKLMKNKKLILAVVALVLVIAAMVGVYLSTRPEAVEGQKNVTVVIVYEDGTEKKLEYATTHEYLSQLLLEKELVTGYESEEFGFTIVSVDGIELNWSEDSAYWALYEGEAYAVTGASGIVLVDGGVYKLVYETF